MDRARSILDALGQVEGLSSTRHQGIGYSQDALFSQPAQVPSTSHQLNKAWVAPSTKRRQAAASSVDRRLKNASPLGGDTVYHRARGILNKLTPERFDKLSLELLNVGIDSELTLRGLIILIFDKAVDEPKFSSLYAQLCERLGKDAPNFDPPNQQINTFYRLLLTKCQDEFESRAKIASDSTSLNFKTQEEWEEFSNTKRKMLGNIRFIGELGKLEVVSEHILHRCIHQLLEKKRTFSLADQAEDLECLCQIMKTVGRRLDTPKAKLWMDQYFKRMASVLAHGDMPSRIRFMMQDVIEMRENNWEPRRVARELLPQTIRQIRQSFPHTRQVDSDMLGRGSSTPKDAAANLFDIFGAPMTSKAAAMADTYRPNSPSGGRKGYGRQDQVGGWSDGRDKDRTDWDSYKDRDQPARDKSDYSAKSRDFQPRYGAKTFSMTGGDKLSLRPGASMSPAFKPSSPHYLPKSARSNNVAAEPIHRESPIYTKPQTPVIIKQEMKQKTKKQDTKVNGQRSGNVATVNQVVQAMEGLWKGEEAEACCGEVIEQLRSCGAKAVTAKGIRQAVKQVLNDGDSSCFLKLSPLLAALTHDGFMDKEGVAKVLVEFVDEVERLEVKHANVKGHIASLLCAAVSKQLIQLDVVCKLFVGGAGHPLALQFLKSVCVEKGEQWLADSFSKLSQSCVQLLPAEHQLDVDAVVVLENYGLLFLEPMLDIQRSIWQQINADPNPSHLLQWILDNTKEQHQAKNEFAFVLFKCLLRYVVNQTSMVAGADISVLPDKAVQEKEKQLFNGYQQMLLHFLHENSERQSLALYSLQVFCHENNFPKGMMLRMFTYLYDLEIVEEDVFLKWKEDINEQYPGKGKALFQVNQWLTWLEQAESESDDD